MLFINIVQLFINILVISKYYCFITLCTCDVQDGVFEDDSSVVTNGNHFSTKGLSSAGNSSSSIEVAIVTRTVAVEPTKSKKNKRNSAHLGSDKYLKSCAMDFQYIEVSDNGTGNGYPPVTTDSSNHHGDTPDTAATGNLLSVEEENISVTSSSDSSSQPFTLAMALENVIIALEEPRGELYIIL